MLAQATKSAARPETKTAIPKFLFLSAFALSLPITSLAQATQASCSPAGYSASQSEAITQTGTGGPYSLTATISTEQTLADGNTITGFTTSHQARDTEGRTRVDRPSFCYTDREGQTHWQGSITVEDPVANTYTLWFDQSPARKTATLTHATSVRTSNPPSAQDQLRMAQQRSQAFEKVGPRSEQWKAEDLGQRNIAGLAASGLRITRTVPSGLRGNAQPLTITEEEWISDRYKLILLDIKIDPTMGKSTFEVTNFTPGEPDVSLFHPPADYSVNERTATQ